MKKIMFNDRYGLTKAVEDGLKTNTRRSAKLNDAARHSAESAYGNPEWETIEKSLITQYAHFKVGEIVAIAQSYKDAGFRKGYYRDEDTLIPLFVGDDTENDIAVSPAGWTNKMFARADLMPLQIRITNVRVERLQDISDEDCIKEGVVKWTKDRELFKYDLSEHYEMFSWSDKPHSPREAFAALIDKVSGKGTWESNPFVFVYDFELVK